VEILHVATKKDVSTVLEKANVLRLYGADVYVVSHVADFHSRGVRRQSATPALLGSAHVVGPCRVDPVPTRAPACVSCIPLGRAATALANMSEALQRRIRPRIDLKKPLTTRTIATDDRFY
jgi:hypothetical protein